MLSFCWWMGVGCHKFALPIHLSLFIPFFPLRIHVYTIPPVLLGIPVKMVTDKVDGVAWRYESKIFVLPKPKKTVYINLVAIYLTFSFLRISFPSRAAYTLFSTAALVSYVQKKLFLQLLCL